MNIAKLILFCLSISSCTGDIENSFIEEPITGGKYSAKAVDIDGWVVVTISEGGMITISKNGESVVTISEGKEQREILVVSPSGKTISLIDVEADNEYESISYQAGDITLTDIGLDGVVNTKYDSKSNELLVTFEGNSYVAQGNKGDRYIMVNNRKIPLAFKYYTYVPQL